MMQDTYWPHIEWEFLQEPRTISGDFDTEEFCNTLSFSPDGLRKITVKRDDDYCLMAVGEGEYIESEQEDQIPEGTLIEKSVIKGTWNYGYRAKMTNCIATNASQTIHTDNFEADLCCDLQMDQLKVRLLTEKPEKVNTLVEWYLNAPGNSCLFINTTKRVSNVKLKRRRGHHGQEKYQVSKSESFSRDCVFISYKDTGFYISKVPDMYEPAWANKLSIEYRREFGRIPGKEERKAIRELAGFLMGRELLYIGKTKYGSSAMMLQAETKNPRSVNVRKVCASPSAELVPVHYYHNEGNHFKRVLECLLPVYMESSMREAISASLPFYWLSFQISLEVAIPTLQTAIETLQKAWFSLPEHAEKSSYYPKAEFRERIRPVKVALQESFQGTESYQVMVNKMGNMNQMSVGDKNQLFYAELGILYGEKEREAVKARNSFTHGALQICDASVVESLHILQILYGKIVLKILGYSGEYIDWSEIGHPRKLL